MSWICAWFTGMLPPFAVESEETRATGKHCTVGIEPRISSERIILLDTQVLYFVAILMVVVFDWLLKEYELNELPFRELCFYFLIFVLYAACV